MLQHIRRAFQRQDRAKRKRKDLSFRKLIISYSHFNRDIIRLVPAHRNPALNYSFLVMNDRQISRWEKKERISPHLAGKPLLNYPDVVNQPDRKFYNFIASKSGDRRKICSSKMLIACCKLYNVKSGLCASSEKRISLSWIFLVFLA